MELEEGRCQCCSMRKVIAVSPKQKIQEILLSLFTERIFNTDALKNCASLLRLCPCCLHKLVSLKEVHDKINSYEAADEKSSNCTLCGEKELCIKVSNTWKYFKEISEDFSVFGDEKKVILCSGCIFYFDTRNAVKVALCSRYPTLKEVPKLKLKLKEVQTQSTPTKKSRTKRGNKAIIDVINLSSDSEEELLDLTPLKGFRALKYDKLFKRSRLISGDSKFMNQIPYIKVNKNDFSSANITEESKSPRTRRSLVNPPEKNIPTDTENHSPKAKKAYSRIKSNKTGSESPEPRKNVFFKIKIKKSVKPKKTNKKEHADHKKKYTHFSESGFDKMLVIKIQRHAIQNADEETISETEEDVKITDFAEKSNDETSMESLVMEADSIENEKISDGEEPQKTSENEPEHQEEEALNSEKAEETEKSVEVASKKDDEEEEGCETVNKPQAEESVSEEAEDETSLAKKNMEKDDEPENGETGEENSVEEKTDQTEDKDTAEVSAENHQETDEAVTESKENEEDDKENEKEEDLKDDAKEPEDNLDAEKAGQENGEKNDSNDKDKDNITSVLEDMQITSELGNGTSNEDDDATTESQKRKRDDSPDDAGSPDRKKKKVTFSDVVLESSD